MPTPNHPKKRKSLPPKKQKFAEHLYELRTRILLCVFVLSIGTVCGYFMKDTIIKILLYPHNQPIFYTNPSGAFDFTLKISFLVGLIISLPFLLYNIIKFIEPVFEKKYKTHYVFFGASFFLLILGMVFAYFIYIPAAFDFLNGFGSDNIKALISASEYLTFVATYLFGFGLFFQLPLVLFIVNFFYKLSVKSLVKSEKWMVLFSFLSAAILSPTTDVFNQFIMALPILILYQVSIVFIYFINKS